MGRYSRRTPPIRPTGVSRTDRAEKFFFVMVGCSIALHLLLVAILNRSPSPRSLHRTPAVTVDLLMAPVANPRRGSSVKAVVARTVVPVAIQKQLELPSKVTKQVIPKKPPVEKSEKIDESIAAMRQRLKEKEVDAAIAAMRNKKKTVAAVATTVGTATGTGDEIGSAIGDWLKEAVRSKWTWSDRKRKDLSAEVEVEFDSAGKLSNYRFIRSSGVDLFDKSLKNALLKLEPLPKPLRKPFKETILFNLDDLQGQ